MMDDLATNLALVNDNLHLFLDARQPTPDTAPQIAQLRRQLSTALKTLFDYSEREKTEKLIIL